MPGVKSPFCNEKTLNFYDWNKTGAEECREHLEEKFNKAFLMEYVAGGDPLQGQFSGGGSTPSYYHFIEIKGCSKEYGGVFSSERFSEGCQDYLKRHGIDSTITKVGYFFRVKIKK